MNKEPRRLFLSSVNKKYRPDQDLVLGPWCFIGQETAYPGWENLPFLNTFDSQSEINNASQECEDLTVFLISEWAERLNKKHQTNYEIGFWWPILVRWVAHTVHAAWRRWVHINKFIEKHRDETIHVSRYSSPEIIKWEFAGVWDFNNWGLISVEFDLYIYSLFLNELAPDHWVLEPIENPDTASIERKKSVVPPFRTSNIKRLGRKLLGRLPFSDIPGVGPAWTVIFSAWIIVFSRRSKANYFFSIKDAPPSRFPKNFLRTLDGLLNSSIPKSLGKNFHEVNSRSMKCRYKKGQLYVLGASACADEFNFQVGHAIINGEQVVRHQHGSGYGTMANASSLSLTEYTMSAFITWGWTKQDNNQGRFVPLPAPSLCRVRNKHKPRNRRIILVGTKTWLRSYRIDHMPEPVQALSYRQDKVNFISALEPELAETVLYRPYFRGQVALEEVNFLSSHFSKLEFLEGPIENAILGCRLLVLDHPGTTLNIAMAANIPTICFWNDNVWPYSKEATPFFKSLQDAGILFQNGKTAASKINNISSDLEGWWKTDQVQNARQAWANQYAHTNFAWWWHWLKKLSRM